MEPKKQKPRSANVTEESSQAENSQSYDLFIAYHGNEQTGSLPAAQEVYRRLNGCDLGGGRFLRVFLQTESNESGAFSHTPFIVKNSKRLLLIADSRIPVDKNGAAAELDEQGRLKRLYEELQAFYNGPFRADMKNGAKVLYFPKLNNNSAKALHQIFSKGKHFDGNKEKALDFSGVIEWAGSAETVEAAEETAGLLSGGEAAVADEKWEYDLCITYPDNSKAALASAIGIYKSLNGRDTGGGKAFKVFLQPAAEDEKGAFKHASAIARTCRKLLFVTDGSVPVNKSGFLAEYGADGKLLRAYETIDAFAQGPYRFDHKGSARVFCINDMRVDAADRLHPMFDGKAHFEGAAEQSGGYTNVFKWARGKRYSGSLANPGIYDNSQIAGNAVKEALENERRKHAKRRNIFISVGAVALAAVLIAGFFILKAAGFFNKSGGLTTGGGSVALEDGVESKKLEITKGNSAEIRFSSSGNSLTDLFFVIESGAVKVKISWESFDAATGEKTGGEDVGDIDPQGIWHHFSGAGRYEYKAVVTADAEGAVFRAKKNTVLCAAPPQDGLLKAKGARGDVFAWSLIVSDNGNETVYRSLEYKTGEILPGGMLFAFGAGYGAGDLKWLNDNIFLLENGEYQIGVILLNALPDGAEMKVKQDVIEEIYPSWGYFGNTVTLAANGLTAFRFSVYSDSLSSLVFDVYSGAIETKIGWRVYEYDEQENIIYLSSEKARGFDPYGIWCRFGEKAEEEQSLYTEYCVIVKAGPEGAAFSVKISSQYGEEWNVDGGLISAWLYERGDVCAVNLVLTSQNGLSGFGFSEMDIEPEPGSLIFVYCDGGETHVVNKLEELNAFLAGKGAGEYAIGIIAAEDLENMVVLEWVYAF